MTPTFSDHLDQLSNRPDFNGYTSVEMLNTSYGSLCPCTGSNSPATGFNMMFATIMLVLLVEVYVRAMPHILTDAIKPQGFWADVDLPYGEDHSGTVFGFFPAFSIWGRSSRVQDARTALAKPRPRRSRRCAGKGYHVRMSLGGIDIGHRHMHRPLPTVPATESTESDIIQVFTDPEILAHLVEVKVLPVMQTVQHSDTNFKGAVADNGFPPPTPSLRPTGTQISDPPALLINPTRPTTPNVLGKLPVPTASIRQDMDVRVWKAPLTPATTYAEYDRQRKIAVQSAKLEQQLIDMRFLQKHDPFDAQEVGEMDGQFGRCDYNANALPVHHMVVGNAAAALCSTRKPDAFLHLEGKDKELYEEDLEDMIDRLRLSDDEENQDGDRQEDWDVWDIGL